MRQVTTVNPINLSASAPAEQRASDLDVQLATFQCSSLTDRYQEFGSIKILDIVKKFFFINRIYNSYIMPSDVTNSYDKNTDVSKK